MDRIRRHWYLVILALPALFINAYTVQWMVAVRVGHFTIADGFKDAFKYFNPQGYLLFTAFGLIPYVALGAFLISISNNKSKADTWPILIGGLIGIMGMILWGSWSTLSPLYKHQHVSSTMAIAFAFIPIYACLPGAVCAAVSVALFRLIRADSDKNNKHETKVGSSNSGVQYCPVCGVGVKPPANYCIRCGAKLK